MKRAKDHNQLNAFTSLADDWLRSARDLAKRIAFEEGSVTAEDINRRHPLPSGLHPNTMGKLFSVRDVFRWNGTKKSQTPSRKGGIISIWMLTDEATEQMKAFYYRKSG